MENEPVRVVVLDSSGYRQGILSEDAATTLIAVASEDPAEWDELVADWPRYVTPVVPEFASNLPLETVSRECALDGISRTDCWIVLDLVQKRFVSGKAFLEITHDACYSMHTDEKGDQHDILSVHLPPWWELREQVDPAEIHRPRRSPAQIPIVDREVLFGKPLIHDLADRILKLAVTEVGRKAIESRGLQSTAEDCDCYPLTIEVHRDWLMTPRDDLGGMCPRQMLHGATNWIGLVVWGQQLRFERDRRQIIAISKSASGYQHGPVGLEEMAVYFDLCRELIASGWAWCKNNFEELFDDWESHTVHSDSVTDSPTPARPASDPPGPAPAQLISQLVAFLNEVKTDWLTQPFEGGSPPAFIIECSRRRVPRGIGVKIVGMTPRQTEQHVIDCDCPICNMMADGMFGVGFTGIDGHHLELDNEFAFSKIETRGAWEAQQREDAEFSDKYDREHEERELSQATGESEADEFASAWSSGLASLTDEPLPGDSNGNLKLAFFLAEIVSELKENAAPEKWVKQLNADFSAYRTADSGTADPANFSMCANNLTGTLEAIAEQFPNLVPRIADLQSRLVERLRE